MFNSSPFTFSLINENKSFKQFIISSLSKLVYFLFNSFIFCNNKIIIFFEFFPFCLKYFKISKNSDISIKSISLDKSISLLFIYTFLENNIIDSLNSLSFSNLENPKLISNKSIKNSLNNFIKAMISSLLLLINFVFLEEII